MGFYSRALVVAAVAGLAYWLLPCCSNQDQFHPDQVRNRNVLITGASSGLGKELAYQYASLGANVFITARSVDKLQKVISKCQEISPISKYGYVVADMTKEQDVSLVMKKAVDFLGSLNFVILNHAVMPNHGFWMGTQENMTSLRKVMEGTFLSHVQLAGDALPFLRQTNGSLTVVSSGGAKLPLFVYTPYISAKHALEAFFRGLRAENLYKDINVSITILTLGSTATEHSQKMRQTQEELLNLEPGFMDKWVTEATVEETASELIRGSARRERDIWYPPHQRLWLVTVLYHIFPHFFEDPTLLYGKPPKPIQ